MAKKTLCPQTRYGEDVDSLQPVSRCPACNRDYDVALILPCSHTMCGHCVVRGERTSPGQSPHQGAGPTACSVLCPCCRRHVELPCWTWSSATTCLPKHPSLSPTRISMETGTKEGQAFEGPLQHWQEHTNTADSAEERARSCLQGEDDPGSNSASSSLTPVDGVVDLTEEAMEQSVFGLRFALDPSSVPTSLHLSSSSLTVTYQGPPTPPPDDRVRPRMTCDSGVPPALPQAWADVVIAQGQYYWEVDVCNSYVYRIGVSSLDSCSGWWLQRQGSTFHAVHDGSREPLYTVPPQIKCIGVFLNVGGGALSFHNPLTHEHLATLPTRFGAAGVLPALGLGQGRLRLRCGLPPPWHVFLSKESTYRGPCVAGGVRWRRELPFRSVRRVIQKFEELAGCDSDSGLVSSVGSSCSTLASLPDLRHSGYVSLWPEGELSSSVRASRTHPLLL